MLRFWAAQSFLGGLQDPMTHSSYPRFEVTARLEDPKSEEPVSVLGLSSSTVTFVCPEPPGIGTEVDVVLHLPALRSSLHAHGRVKFQSRMEPADIAVELLSIEASGAELLRRYLDQVLSAQSGW